LYFLGVASRSNTQFQQQRKEKYNVRRKKAFMVLAHVLGSGVCRFRFYGRPVLSASGEHGTAQFQKWQEIQDQGTIHLIIRKYIGYRRCGFPPARLFPMLVN
jgi:hypothetical protein